MLNRGHDRHKDLKSPRGRGTIRGSSSATLSLFLDCCCIFVKVYVKEFSEDMPKILVPVVTATVPSLTWFWRGLTLYLVHRVQKEISDHYSRNRAAGMP